MDDRYGVGLDFGTNSVRAVIVAASDGRELGSGLFDYAHGDMGVVIDPNDPHVARQHPEDYIHGISVSVSAALKQARTEVPDCADRVVGIGVDSTGSVGCQPWSLCMG